MIFDYQETIVMGETAVIPGYVVCPLPKETAAIKETIGIFGGVHTSIDIGGIADEIISG